MDCAPLNMAHFHERRADKLIKQHRYEDAFKAIETSLLYVDDAYKHVQIPKALEVLRTHKWEYERKLNQVQMRKLQYERMKSKEIVPSAQVDVASNNIKTDIVNAQSIARSIDKTIKEFNNKYSSTLLENVEQSRVQTKDNKNLNYSNNQKTARLNNSQEIQTEYCEKNTRRLNLMDNHLQSTDDDMPSLAPLELPSFDFNVFGLTSVLEKKFQN